MPRLLYLREKSPPLPTRYEGGWAGLKSWFGYMTISI